MLSIEQYEKRLQESHCLVVGDVMLDEYISGEVSRISPEAPVPIVHMKDRRYILGGAANVAANIRSYGVNVTLIGAIGEDPEALMLNRALESRGIMFYGIASPKRVTTVKTRIMGKSHQIVRVDKEQTDALDIVDEDSLLGIYEEIIKSTDIVVISDYNKGTCTERVCTKIIALCEKHHKNAIVDPKRADWTRYGGAFLIKPNLNELKIAANHVIANDDEEIARLAKKMMADFSIANILVTRSQDGMMLVNYSGVFNFKAEAQEVFDVSGAGDTVIATISAFLSVHTRLYEAVQLSNIAAGISVNKLGTYAVKFEELSARLNGAQRQKIVSNVAIDEIASDYKKKGKKIVFTNGCFDILHVGHITFLAKAKKLGDILIVGLNSDASVRRLKGKDRPVNTESDRALMLSALETVDIIVLFEEDTPYELISRIVPEILVKGADYTPEIIAGHDVVEMNGGQVVILPLVAGKSTSKIIKAINRKTPLGS